MADDPELAAIRARRMAELQQNMGGPNPQSHQDQEEQMRQQAEMKNRMLTQILDQQARARLNTIAVAKPEKAKMVEEMLINMARARGIQQKINDDQLRQMLVQVSEKTEKKTTVTYDRRRAALDSDSD